MEGACRQAGISKAMSEAAKLETGNAGAAKPNRLTAVGIGIAVLLVGAALVRLSIIQQVTERRAGVADTARQSADAIAEKLSVAAKVTDRLTDELTLQNSIAEFHSLADQGRKQLGNDDALFLLPAEESANGTLLASGPAINELKQLDWKNASGDSSREPELIGPVRLSNGEWVAFIRSPLVFSGPGGSRSFWGWAAAAMPVEGLLRSAGLDELPKAGLDYEFAYLTSDSRGLRTVARSTAETLNTPAQQPISPVPDRWFLLVAPATGWIPWSLLIAELLVVVVVALAAALMIDDLRRRPEELAMEIEARDRRLHEIHQRLNQEIEQREELEKQIGEATYHDAFTGLPNRSFLIDRLTRALQRSRLEPGYLIAVLILNFGRYKNIIETLGATAGDQLLNQAVKRIEGSLRPQDLVVARVADDEFATLLFDIGSHQAAAAAAKRLTDALSESFSIDGQSVFATVKMGIALSSTGYEDANELVGSAHMALSQVTTDQQEQYAIFDPATREQLITRHQLETDLYQAIERNEFRLYYQPIVSLETGNIVGMEALIRWMHPLEGLLPPLRFIPLAEETGQVVPITRWVVKEAARQARVWRSRFPAGVEFYISANLSAQDLKQPDVCDFVAAVLGEAGLPPGVMRLEVTESMMIGSLKTVGELVSRFRDMHVPLLLDDFGTGYSSLSYLNRFQFDYIKIDRAFVSRITGANQNSGIVRTIVHLAREMGSKTIAEGVDNDQALDELRKLGCDYAQGYFFSKPVDAAAAEQLLLSRPSWHPSASVAGPK